jgi:hypothetical protein
MSLLKFINLSSVYYNFFCKLIIKFKMNFFINKNFVSFILFLSSISLQAFKTNKFNSLNDNLHNLHFKEILSYSLGQENLFNKFNISSDISAIEKLRNVSITTIIR